MLQKKNQQKKVRQTTEPFSLDFFSDLRERRNFLGDKDRHLLTTSNKKWIFFDLKWIKISFPHLHTPDYPLTSTFVSDFNIYPVKK